VNEVYTANFKSLSYLRFGMFEFMNTVEKTFKPTSLSGDKALSVYWRSVRVRIAVGLQDLLTEIFRGFNPCIKANSDIVYLV
jgi:hypothetical protein